MMMVWRGPIIIIVAQPDVIWRDSGVQMTTMMMNPAAPGFVIIDDDDDGLAQPATRWRCAGATHVRACVRVVCV